MLRISATSQNPGIDPKNDNHHDNNDTHHYDNDHDDENVQKPERGGQDISSWTSGQLLLGWL